MRLREFDEKERLLKANEKLEHYKTAAGADATAADAAGNFARGNRRFKGINAATKKQFDNDAKLAKLKEQGVAEAGFPGAPDVEMPPMKPSGDPQRDKLKQEYMDLHREIKSLVDLQYNSKSNEEKMQAKARIKQLNDRADEIRAILEPRQPPNEWQKKTYGYDDNWNRVGKGVAEGDYPDGSSVKTPDSSEWQQQYQQAVDKVNKAKTQQEYEAASERAGKIKDFLASKGIKVGPVLGKGMAEGDVDEAKYQGREVPLGKKMAGDVKKSKVYVRKPNGNIVKVNFGDKKMRIKKSNPARRKSFRARHNCANPGPRHKARYWSCRSW